MNAARQHTLAREFTLRGVGLHTGNRCAATIAPAPADAGFSFQVAGATIPATPDAVRSTTRCTTLAGPSGVVNTVEHVLAALSGMGVDNAAIAVEGDEIPILDGSALPFAQEIKKAGLREQAQERRYLEVREPAWFEEDGKLLAVLPADEFSISFFVAFPEPVGHQFLATPPIAPDYFLHEIAPNRTFGFRHEVEALAAQGLARGGSLDNAVVIDTDGYMGPLRFPDEIVRHKALDLIGDFALIGMPLRARVVAVKSGHALHVAAARALRELLAPAN
ncbi:MAG: UDP-3-O-[3-hydroxymyristoyl] N-acetylglucosamine deacetylase [Candidatus Eremiobacteraeota bacterium]|nr:UDP-3-O-[3-hydroxymyristoyl] N-acetylglucosamine deacetylase [Candidatus Eremiobacteraeota bacterium]MBV8366467.1 UDP-3-O-[3-hydroxymyristoyl] N-acetylglucosamine deacetylase [Candidatus Eremiobacteraeota bacterium]